jgi:hypothetical protein
MVFSAVSRHEVVTPMTSTVTFIVCPPKPAVSIVIEGELSPEVIVPAETVHLNESSAAGIVADNSAVIFIGVPGAIFERLFNLTMEHCAEVRVETATQKVTNISIIPNAFMAVEQ